MQNYVRLSERSPAEVRALGEVYQQMAATARTPEAKRGLELLAARLASLAARLAGSPEHQDTTESLAPPCRHIMAETSASL